MPWCTKNFRISTCRCKGTCTGASAAISSSSAVHLVFFTLALTGEGWPTLFWEANVEVVRDSAAASAAGAGAVGAVGAVGGDIGFPAGDSGKTSVDAEEMEEVEEVEESEGEGGEEGRAARDRTGLSAF